MRAYSRGVKCRLQNYNGKEEYTMSRVKALPAYCCNVRYALVIQSHKLINFACIVQQGTAYSVSKS